MNRSEHQEFGNLATKANFKSNDREIVSQSINIAREILEKADIREQPELILEMLFGLKYVIIQVEDAGDFDKRLGIEAADVFIRQFRQCSELSDIPKSNELDDWFNDQLNYDGIILNTQGDIWLEYIEGQLAPILRRLDANDSEVVAGAIEEARSWLNDGIYTGTAPIFVPLLLALKIVVDHNQVLEKSVVDNARELLLEELRLNRFLAPQTPEMKELYSWYEHQTKETSSS